jgi:Zn-finger nucleic acid-binding protein
MYCPVCKETELKISERQGVEIDYCAQCRGVWLDRGELDKLIERSARMEYSGAVAATPLEYVAPQSNAPRSSPGFDPRYDRRRDYDRDYDDDDDYRLHKRRKKGGWLGEILDFD